MKLSKNFSSEEFTKIPYEQLPKLQQLMLQNITNNILQPIRNEVGKSITVTSGMRTSEDYERLKAKGFFPSESSDHFYGTGFALSDPNKILKYGKTYFYSVGAADFTVLGMLPKDVFNICYHMVQNGELDIGQLILEYGGVGGSSWIHVSNPQTLIYSLKASDLFKKTKVLTSDDGGKTYKPYIV
jgi:hypothetical protein